MDNRLQFWVLIALVAAAVGVAFALGGVYSGPKDEAGEPSEPSDVPMKMLSVAILAVSWLLLLALLLFYRTRRVQWPIVLGAILLVFGTDRFVRLLDKRDRSILRKGDSIVAMASLGASLLIFAVYMFSLRAIAKDSKEQQKYRQLAEYLEGDKTPGTNDGIQIASEAEVRSLLDMALGMEPRVIITNPSDSNREAYNDILTRLQGYFDTTSSEKLSAQDLREMQSRLRQMPV